MIRRPGPAARRAPAPPPTSRLLPVLAVLALLAVSCARKGPPSGGPPDLVPPTITGTAPDSGAARVGRDARLAITFSEGMEPRATAEAVSLAPPVAIAQRRWSGRTLTLVLADSLAANRTYTWFVAPGARDRHGNPLDRGYAYVFTTADTLPPGVLEGTLESRGFTAAGTYLWCYEAGRTGVPDSTARDFDALGFVDRDGRFRVVGLKAPGLYRLWVFADLDRNRSFEPERDVLAAADTLLELTAERPLAGGLRLRAVNPRAPGTVKGTIVDTLRTTDGARWLRAVPADSTLRTRVEPQSGEGFELALPPGRWRVMLFRDLDRNKSWDPERESSSEEVELVLGPADVVTEVVFVLRRPGAR